MYPKKVEYWICSDKRTFQTEKEAEEHERFLEREKSYQTSYSYLISGSLADMWF